METIDRAKELAGQTGRPWDEMGAYEREMFMDEARKEETENAQTKLCPRCHQEMEIETDPDGCRDPNCPMLYP